MKFSSDIQAFLDENAGFEPDLKWEDRVNESHGHIRKLFGGNTLTLEYKTDATYEGIPSEDAHKIYKYLKNNCPDYLNKYNIYANCFIKERINSNKPKSNNSHKWTKHIPEYFKRNDLVPPLDLSSFISDLGETYAKYKNKKVTLYVVATTEPIAFTMMGHMGADGNSCFRQSSQNPHHKFILGQTKGSFVVLISDSPLDITYKGLHKSESVLARLWGIHDPQSEKTAICNYYSNPNGKLRNTVFGHVPKILDLIMGEGFESKDVGPHLGVKNVYYNNRGNKHDVNICFFKHGSWPETQHSFICNNYNLCTSKQTSCGGCGRRTHQDSIFKDPIVDNSRCYACVNKLGLTKSDLTGIESISKDIVLYKDSNGEIKKAFSSEVGSEIRSKTYLEFSKKDKTKVKLTSYVYPLIAKKANKINIIPPTGLTIQAISSDTNKTIEIKNNIKKYTLSSNELFKTTEYEIVE